MGQTYNDIPSTDTLTVSRQKILDRDDSIKSCFSGTTHPTADLLIGMLSYRTDSNSLFELKSTGPSIWVLIADLDDPPSLGSELTNHLADLADPHAVTPAQIGAPTNATFNAHTADVANPHAVTKTQVGLSAVPNTDATNASNLASGTILEARMAVGSNADGLRTVSTASPSGGVNGDIWFRY